MSPRELVQAFESARGVLTVDGGDVRFFCPKSAAPFVELIRHHREGVLEILQVRAMESVLRWIQQRCVCARRVRANPRILHREYSFTKCAKRFALSYENFLETLLDDLHLHVDEQGMVLGLCLSEDFLAAVVLERKQRFLM